MPTKPKQRLLDFELDEISLVDRPAQKGARFVLRKRDDTYTPTYTPDPTIANAVAMKLLKAIDPEQHEQLSRTSGEDDEDLDAEEEAFLASLEPEARALALATRPNRRS
jgi:hypothetical protein